MAERIAYLQAVVGADISSFRYAMQRVRDEIGLLGTHVNRVSETARLATYTISAPLTLMGAGFLKAATDFDAAMRDVNSKAQLTEAEFQSLNKEVMSFSQTVRANAVEVANALSVVYGAGVQNNEQAMKLMQEAVRMSEGTGGALQRTTEALVSAVNAFGSEVMPVERASDAIVRLYQDGIGTMDSFATSIGRLNPMLAALNIEIEEGYAILGYFTQRGLSAEEAGTAFNQMLTNTIKPSVAMQRSLRQLGVKGFGELIDDSGSLIEAFKLLVDTTDGSSEALGELFTNVRSMRAVNLLQNDIEGATEAVLAFQEAVEGSTELVWEEQMKSFAAQIDLLSSAFMNMSINIGNKLIPIVEPFVQGLTQIFIQIANLDEATTQATVAFGIFIAALFPLIWLFTSILTPAGLLTTAVIGLAGALMFDFAGVRTTVMNTINDLTGGFDGLAAAIGRVISAAFEDQTIPTFEDWSAGMLPESVNLGAPNTVTFTVGDQGMSLFDFWSANLQDQFPDWNAFYREIAADRSTAVGETFEFNLGTPIFTFGGLGADPNKHMSEQVDGLMMAYDQEVANARSQTSKGFFGRLTEQLEAELPLIEAELDRIFDTLRLSISEKVSTFFTNLANSFTVSSEESGEGGDTPFYSALKGLFSLDVGQISSDLRTQFDKAFPEVTSSIETFLSSLGTWILTTGLPTLSRTFGYISGQLVSFILGAVSVAFNALKTGEVRGVLKSGITGVSDTLVDPFFAGVNDAFASNDIAISFDASLYKNIALSLTDLVLGGVEYFINNPAMLISGLVMLGLANYVMGAIAAAIAGGAASAAGAAVAGAATAAVVGAGATTAINTTALGLIGTTPLPFDKIPAAAGAASGASAAVGTSILSMIGNSFKSALASAFGGTIVGGMVSSLVAKIATSIAALGATAPAFASLAASLGTTIGLALGNIIIPVAVLSIAVGLLKVAFDTLDFTSEGKTVAQGIMEENPNATPSQLRERAWREVSAASEGYGIFSDVVSRFAFANVEPSLPKVPFIPQPAIDEANRNLETLATNLSITLQDIYDNMPPVIQEAIDNMKNFSGGVETETVNFATSTSDLTTEVSTLASIFTTTGTLISTNAAVLGTALINAANTINGAMAGLGGGGTGGGGANFSAQATGGMLRGGVPYLVGEAGRELFVPTTDGRLYPSFRTNEMMRSSRRQESSAVVTNNITINGVQDFDTFVSEMQRRGISFKS